MNWKIKALIQNTISYFPSSLSYAFYYFLQRKFGGLKEINPVNELTKGIDIWKTIKKQKNNPVDKIFFEIGTGRLVLVPLSFWLMGAKKTITIDANPYIKTELIKESLRYILKNKTEIKNLFGSLLDNERWGKLLSFARESSFSKTAFLRLCNTTYIAPGDAANTSLKNDSIDFHLSNLVFEHIPLKVLEKILVEGHRIVHKGGLFIHDIDYSDHFSHSDLNISSINFLSFSDEKWKWYAGNRYMYMNRLRHDDFLNLFHNMGWNALEVRVKIDERVQFLLRDGNISLDDRFKKKSENILSIYRSTMVFQKNNE